jgi:hypothetical protein
MYVPVFASDLSLDQGSRRPVRGHRDACRVPPYRPRGVRADDGASRRRSDATSPSPRKARSPGRSGRASRLRSRSSSSSSKPGSSTAASHGARRRPARARPASAHRSPVATTAPRTSTWSGAPPRPQSPPRHVRLPANLPGEDHVREMCQSVRALLRIFRAIERKVPPPLHRPTARVELCVARRR